MKYIPNPFKVFVTPEYLFRPSQIAVRIKRGFDRMVPDRTRVAMPWNVSLWVYPSEVIGSQIWYYGIFDLLVAEVIFRLLDRNEVSADVGANLGQMTSLMACKTGAGGLVHAWEPHPGLFYELTENVSGLVGDFAPIQLHESALGRESGRVSLVMGADWKKNRGTARVVAQKSPENTHMDVLLDTLDESFGRAEVIHLLKVDVEGFEREVFDGAASLLKSGRVRDILFEDITKGESGVVELLRSCGYKVFGLAKRVLGPELVSGGDAASESDNYLATIEPERAGKRLRARGWRVLRRPRSCC